VLAWFDRKGFASAQRSGLGKSVVVPRPRQNRGKRKTIEDGNVVVQPEIRGCAQRHPVERFSRWLPNIVLVAGRWSG
jgi:hypothetical protein